MDTLADDRSEVNTHCARLSRVFNLKKLSKVTKGRKRQIKSGIDKGADAIEAKAGKHADKVDKAADAAKKAVDKLPD